MPEYRFWNLLAKKISGEATAEEMQELEDLMRLHPEYHYAAQHIQDIWGLSSAEDPLASEESFKRHLNRMKKMGITLANPENDENDLENTRPKRNRKKLLFIGFMGIVALVAFFFLQSIYKST